MTRASTPEAAARRAVRVEPRSEGPEGEHDNARRRRPTARNADGWMRASTTIRAWETLPTLPESLMFLGMSDGFRCGADRDAAMSGPRRGRSINVDAAVCPERDWDPQAAFPAGRDGHDTSTEKGKLGVSRGRKARGLASGEIARPPGAPREAEHPCPNAPTPEARARGAARPRLRSRGGGSHGRESRGCRSRRSWRWPGHWGRCLQDAP